MDPPVRLIDVRTVPPRDRQPLIFATFDALAVGQALEIVNDHDPWPLRQRFEQLRGGRFDWRYLEAGPPRWHVRIARLAGGGVAAPPGGGDIAGGGCADDRGGRDQEP